MGLSKLIFMYVTLALAALVASMSTGPMADKEMAAGSSALLPDSPQFLASSSPGSPEHVAKLATKLHRLAKLLSKRELAPTHVRAHAHMLASLAVHEVQTHVKTNGTLAMASYLNQMDTEEQIEKDVWLTQHDIDLIADERDADGNVIFHSDDTVTTIGEKPHDLDETTAKGVSARANLAASDIDCQVYRWAQAPGSVVVPWCFETRAGNTVTEATKGYFRRAVAQAQEEINLMGQCITFTERPEACDAGYDGTNFYDTTTPVSTMVVGSYDTGSCYSWCARSNKPSQINLGWCNQESHIGSMIHEIGHNMGLGHEQTRPDRNNFVLVTSTSGQSALDPNGDDHRPYSYQSLMHYPTYAGVQTPAGIEIGRRTGGYNGNDISQIRHIYECAPYARSVTAVQVASGYTCQGTPLTGSTPGDCAKIGVGLQQALSDSTCSIFHFDGSQCTCCANVMEAASGAGNLYQVSLVNSAEGPPLPPPSPPSPPGAPAVGVTVTLTAASWASEISLKIDETEVVAQGSVSDHATSSYEVQLTPGSHTLKLMDSYGDGWHGGYVTLTAGGTEIGSYGTDFTSGSDKSYDFEVGTSSAGSSPPPVAVSSPPPVAVSSPPPVAVSSPPPVAVSSPPPVAVSSPPPVAVSSPPPATSGGGAAVTITLTTATWASEISLQLDDTVLVQQGSLSDNSQSTYQVSLTTGSHTLKLMDSYGDGWHGGYLTLTAGNTELGTYGSDFTSGSQMDVPLMVIVASPSSVVIKQGKAAKVTTKAHKAKMPLKKRAAA